MTSKPKTIDEIAKAYDSPPMWYDLRGYLILLFTYNSTILHQLRFFSRNVGHRHLEIACGSGTLLKMVLFWRWLWGQPAPHSVDGIDYAPSMLAGAIHRFVGHKDIHLYLADVAHMPFADDVYDTINIANAIHCFPQINEAIRDIYRVLKPGGHVAVNVLLYPRGNGLFSWIANRINRWGIKKGILTTPYTEADICSKLSVGGFQIKESRISGNCLDLVLLKP